MQIVHGDKIYKWHTVFILVTILSLQQTCANPKEFW